jgi:exodeoxyribonuclease V alpha subunit
MYNSRPKRDIYRDYRFTVRVRHQIFKAEESDYVVLCCDFPRGYSPQYKPDSSGVLTGEYAPEVEKGCYLDVTGRYIKHDTYGWQFEASSIMPSLRNFQNAGDAAFLRFLMEDHVEGIPSDIIGRLIASYGENTIRVIEDAPEILSDFETLEFGSKEQKEFLGTWSYLRKNLPYIYVLAGYGVPKELSDAIFRKYNRSVMNVLQKNPYQMLNDDIPGMDFHYADLIAMRVGHDRFDPARFRAGLETLLDQELKSNRISFSKEELTQKYADLLAIPEEKAAEYIKANIQKCADLAETENEYVVRWLADLKEKIERGIEERLSITPETADAEVDWKKLNRVLKFKEKTLSDQQKTAVRMALNHSIVLIEANGKHKTGKGLTIKAIAEQFKLLDRKVTKIKTVSKENRVSTPQKPYFEKSQTVIFETAEGLNLPYFADLLDTLRDDQTLILFGDTKAPQGSPGNVLYDLLSMKNLPKLHLLPEDPKHAQACAQFGDDPFAILESDRTHFIEETDEKKAADKIVELVSEHIPDKVDAFNDVDVITPLKEGVCGTEKLNAKISEALHPDFWTIPFLSREFRLADRVIQTRDFPLQHVPAGQIGIISNFDRLGKQFTVRIVGQDREAVYDAETAKNLELAYAFTPNQVICRKYAIVVMPITQETVPHLSKNDILSVCAKTEEHIFFVGQRRLLEQILHLNDD